MSKKLFFNSLSGTLLFLTNIGVAFIMSPILISALGNRNYGFWELVMSIVGYMGLLDLGFGTALVRFVSLADGSQDRKELQRTISTAFLFFIGVGLVAVLLFFIISFNPELIVGKELRDIVNFKILLLLLGLHAGILFPLQVFIATLMGLQRHYFINNCRIGIAIVQAILVYYLVNIFKDKGLIVLALLAPIFTAIEFILFSAAVAFDKEIPNISISAVNSKKLREMIVFSSKSAVMMIASRIQNQSVPLIIGHVIGLGHIVYFVIPNRLVNYAKGMSLAIGFPLSPFFGAAIGRGDRGWLVKSWVNTSIILQAIGLAMPLFILFCGPAFLKIWIGPEYAEAGRIVLYILVIGLIFDSLSSNAFRMLTAQGKHGRCALTWLIFAVFSVPAGILGAYQWGIEGVAAMTALVTMLANVVTLYMACKVMQMTVLSYLYRTLLRILPALALLATALWGFVRVFPVSGYLSLVTIVSGAGIIYLWSLWGFGMNKETRKRVKDKIMTKISVIKSNP